MVAAGYAALTAAVCVYEAMRIRVTKADLLTVFITLFVLQCCLPGVAIYLCLPFLDPQAPTGNAVFDRIFSTTDFPTALLVLGLVACTVFFLYAFTGLNQLLLRRLLARPPSGSYFILTGFPARLVVLLGIGFLLTSISFYTLGDTLFERYGNLILLRAHSDTVPPTLLNRYGFGLTQTWAWLAVATLFVIFEQRGRDWLWWLCLLLIVVFAVLCVDRKAIFIPIFLGYMTFLLFDGRWRFTVVIATAIPILVWVAFGKEILGHIAYGYDVSEVTGRYYTFTSAALRTASEVGITLVESCGSISLLDLYPRLGVDHLLSVLRRVPVAWFGWDLDLPKPIVRVSTEAFSTSNDSDIPPGLFGQMWLDFRIFGPVIWAFVLSLELSIVQRVFALTIPTRQALAVFVLMTFLIALPVNTGSYDFTFSVDVLLLLVCIWLAFKVERVRVVSRSLDHESPGTAEEIPRTGAQGR